MSISENSSPQFGEGTSSLDGVCFDSLIPSRSLEKRYFEERLKSLMEWRLQKGPVQFSPCGVPELLKNPIGNKKTMISFRSFKLDKIEVSKPISHKEIEKVSKASSSIKAQKHLPVDPLLLIFQEERLNQKIENGFQRVFTRSATKSDNCPVYDAKGCKAVVLGFKSSRKGEKS